jgi:hypothetical protein
VPALGENDPFEEGEVTFLATLQGRREGPKSPNDCLYYRNNHILMFERFFYHTGVHYFALFKMQIEPSIN